MSRPRRAVGAAVAAAVAVLAAACSSGAEPAACGPVTHPPLQYGNHLVGDAAPPVAYSSTPGTSGWHAGGRPQTGFFAGPQALTEPEIVAVLETGGVVVAYDPGGVTRADVETLRALTAEHAGLTVTPFTGDMGAPVVINAWGTRQACSGVDADAVAAFVAEHGGRGGH